MRLVTESINGDSGDNGGIGGHEAYGILGIGRIGKELLWQCAPYYSPAYSCCS